jgi:hypothetical protein
VVGRQTCAPQNAFRREFQQAGDLMQVFRDWKSVSGFHVGPPEVLLSSLIGFLSRISIVETWFGAICHNFGAP